MAELNYYERPKSYNIKLLSLWDQLNNEKSIFVLSKDYDNSWLVVFNDGERRYITDLANRILSGGLN